MSEPMTTPTTQDPRAEAVADIRNRDYPARIWAERDPDTNEKRWFSIRGSGVEYALASDLPDDVRRLVIAARDVAYSDPVPETMRELDKAAEAFAERIPWDDEPDNSASPSAPVPARGGVEAEREAFEAWITATPYPRCDLSRGDGGAFGTGYVNAKTSLAWDAWKARASLSPAPTSGAEVGGEDLRERIARVIGGVAFRPSIVDCTACKDETDAEAFRRLRNASYFTADQIIALLPHPELMSASEPADGHVRAKPVVWERYWGGGNEDIPCWRADTPIGLVLDVDFIGEGLKKHSDADPERLAAKQADAFAKYEGRLRAALSPSSGGRG